MIVRSKGWGNIEPLWLQESLKKAPKGYKAIRQLSRQLMGSMNWWRTSDMTYILANVALLKVYLEHTNHLFLAK